MKLYMLQNVDPEILGFLPGFLDEENQASARDQLDANYAHGGGWSPMDGFKFDAKDKSIKYPGDPKHKPIAYMHLHDAETIYFYDSAWVCIVQPDGKYEVARMD